MFLRLKCRYLTAITISAVFIQISFYTVYADTYGAAKSRVSKDEIDIGDQIRLDVIAGDAGEGRNVVLPDEPGDLGEFVFIHKAVFPKKLYEKGAQGESYIIGIYTTGVHVIPPVKLEVHDNDNNAIGEQLTNQVPVTVRSVLTGEETDIKDIKGLIPFKRGLPLHIILILVIAVVLSAAGYFVYYRRKKEEEARLASRKPHELAYEALNDLKKMDLPGRGEIKKYYIELSGIIRVYIERRFKYNAPDMTTEEFLISVKNSDDMSDDNKNDLKRFLVHCDMVKFAKYGPTPIEILDSYKSAERFIDNTKENEPYDTGDDS